MFVCGAEMCWRCVYLALWKCLVYKEFKSVWGYHVNVMWIKSCSCLDMVDLVVGAGGIYNADNVIQKQVLLCENVDSNIYRCNNQALQLTS